MCSQQTEDTVAVFVFDDESPVLLGMKGLRLLQKPTDASIRKARAVFVLSSITSLREAASVVLKARKLGLLGALFVRQDMDPSWLLPQLREAGIAQLGNMRNLLVHAHDSELPQRVLFAWSIGAQDSLIADATAVSDDLLVRDCALRSYRVPFSKLPALSKLSTEDRRDFVIARNGNYLHWPKKDIHIGLENIKQALNPHELERAKARRLSHDRRFGRAVAALRKKSGLRQMDIEGLSERQVRRVERGTGLPRPDSIAALARTHGMQSTEYLNAVAATMDEV